MNDRLKILRQLDEEELLLKKYAVMIKELEVIRNKAEERIEEWKGLLAQIE